MANDIPLFSEGAPDTTLTDQTLCQGLTEALAALEPRRRVLVLPAVGDTYQHSTALLLKSAVQYYGNRLAAIIPALGNRPPLGQTELATHYPGVSQGLFRSHDWYHDVTELGRVPADFVHQVSAGLCSFDWPVQVNRLITEGGFDLILSIGQVAPHEIFGFADYSSNIFIGTGGKDSIDQSYWLAAAYGIERILGKMDNPVRAVLDYAQERIAGQIPILYALTVAGGTILPSDPDQEPTTAVRGFYAGTGRSTFAAACALSASVNIARPGQAVRKVVVWLDPQTYRSTWWANNALYRTRLAIADGGELLILAPGLEAFGVDPATDATIRDYGYCGTARIRELVESGELAGDLAGAAHLAQGSSDDRFTIRYAPGHLSRAEVEDVGYQWADLASMMDRYNPAALTEGWNNLGGEHVFFIKNPSLGIWSA
jgi:hypothetical protein